MRMLFTTYDSEVNRFGPIFECPNDAFAKRMFNDAIKHSEELREHKDTLSLIKLGDFAEVKETTISPCYKTIAEGKKFKGKELDNILDSFKEKE